MTRSYTIGDICDVVSSGGTPSRKHPEYFTTTDSGHLWVKSKELLDGAIRTTEERITDEGLNCSSAKYYPEHTVLVAMYGANVGQLAWLRKPATVNQAVCGLVVNPASADFRFVFYTLLLTRGELAAKAQGAAQQNLNQDLIRSFRISLPELRVQQAVASILSAYDHLIENNTRRITILEHMAQMIYREWFVNFRFPGHERVRLVESESGPMPAGWASKSLDNLMDFQGGAQPPKSDWINQPRDGFVRMIQIRDYETDAHLGFVRDSRNLRKCQEADIMIARYGASVGRICWGLVGAYNVALVRVVPHESYHREFLRSYLSSDTLQRLLIGMSGRTAQAGFNKAILSAITLPVPLDAALFRQYEDISQPIRELILCLRRGNRTLRTTRDFLLPKLLSGEIAVEVADETVVELMEGIAQPA